MWRPWSSLLLSASQVQTRTPRTGPSRRTNPATWYFVSREKGATYATGTTSPTGRRRTRCCFWITERTSRALPTSPVGTATQGRGLGVRSCSIAAGRPVPHAEPEGGADVRH